MLIRTAGDKQWKSPSVSNYEDEAAIQALLEASPDLLPNTNGSRLAVAREVAVGSGSVDLVGVEPAGAITLVECKLRANSEIRRHVVGQVFAYAAALWEMSYESFDQAFAARAGQSLASSVAALSQEEWAEETFRREVADNLKSGRFRLVIVVDQITDELGRIVSFLNAHTIPDVQVLALELRYMADEGVEILMPTIYGAESVRAKVSTSPGAARWDEEQFFAAIAACCTPAGYAAARDLYCRAKNLADLVTWGSGPLPAATFRFRVADRSVPMLSLYEWPKGKGKAAINFEYLVGNLPDETIRELANRLRGIPVMAAALNGLEAAAFKKRPSIGFDTALTDDHILRTFWEAIASIVDSAEPYQSDTSELFDD